MAISKEEMDKINRTLERNLKYAPMSKGGRGLPHPICKKCNHEDNSLHHIENCQKWKF